MCKNDLNLLSERLNKVIKDRNLKVKDIVKNTDTSQRAIYNYINAEKMPRLNFLIVFAKVYDVQPLWLITGQGEPYFKNNNEFTELNEIDPNELTQIAYYENMNDLLNDRKITISSTPTHLLDGDIVLNIDDGSIDKGNSSTVQVIFKKQSYLLNEGDMMLLEYNKKLLVRNVFYSNDKNFYELKTPSGKYDDIIVNKNDVKLMGKKTGVFYSG